MARTRRSLSPPAITAPAITIPIAIASDLLAAAIVPLATISERRIDRLVDPTLQGLRAVPSIVQ